ncbi:MAG: hypothetical protein EXQ50_06155 [Acidobacteria bacterium]|nr:hypothetical protein [Acidobacteriota bacterium]MSO83487.1 hypothetical protein [Acidobacteriota bacterium]
MPHLFDSLWLIRGRRQVYLAPGQVLQSSRRVVVSPGMGPTDAECVRACVLSHDAAYVLEDGANLYLLSDQKTPARFAARKVEVIGTLDPKTRTIAVESIAAAR